MTINILKIRTRKVFRDLSRINFINNINYDHY